MQEQCSALGYLTVGETLERFIDNQNAVIMIGMFDL